MSRGFMKDDNLTLISVKINKKEWGRFKAIALKSGISCSAYIRTLIYREIKDGSQRRGNKTVN